MSFIQHSIAWARGEIFEASIMGGVGLLLLVIAFLYWRIGSTPGAKAMILPLLAVGLILGVAGISGRSGNQKHIERCEALEPDALPEFVRAEKERVEGFESLYNFTMILAPICFAAACIIFWLTLNPHARGVAVALLLIGASGLVIDLFAKERGDIYYGKILEELGETKAGEAPAL